LAISSFADFQIAEFNDIDHRNAKLAKMTLANSMKPNQPIVEFNLCNLSSQAYETDVTLQANASM
jgi:hypothetical protein